MGQFINEVAKINQNYNHKYKISEERDNVRNALYKRFYKEFKNHGEDYDDTYNYLANIRTKDTICMREYDFGTHVTWEFVDTTYYKELKKVYKIFKEHERTEKAQENKVVISPLYIVLDKKGCMEIGKTFKYHAEHCVAYNEEVVGDKRIKYYKILDNNGCNYDFKIYFYENGLIDNLTTYNEIRKDGILDGVKMPSCPILSALFLLIVGGVSILGFGLKVFGIIALIFFLIVISTK